MLPFCRLLAPSHQRCSLGSCLLLDFTVSPWRRPWTPTCQLSPYPTGIASLSRAPSKLLKCPQFSRDRYPNPLLSVLPTLNCKLDTSENWVAVPAPSGAGLRMGTSLAFQDCPSRLFPVTGHTPASFARSTWVRTPSPLGCSLASPCPTALAHAGGQDRTPQKVPLWHANYFKLKAFESLKAQEKLFPLPWRI